MRKSNKIVLPGRDTGMNSLVRALFIGGAIIGFVLLILVIVLAYLVG